MHPASSAAIFDWNILCFVCGGKCYSNKRDSVSIVGKSKVDPRTTYMQVLKIAQERNDTEVVLRMQSIPNGDLISVQARYHRRKGCLAW